MSSARTKSYASLQVNSAGKFVSVSLIHTSCMNYSKVSISSQCSLFSMKMCLQILDVVGIVTVTVCRQSRQLIFQRFLNKLTKPQMMQSTFTSRLPLNTLNSSLNSATPKHNATLFHKRTVMKSHFHSI